jgi:hypothetical protein
MKNNTIGKRNIPKSSNDISTFFNKRSYICIAGRLGSLGSLGKLE